MEKLELSLSPNYVTDWGLNEAVREILQNAIDSQVDGNKIEITFIAGKLTIKTIGANLDKKTLLLGNSGKGDNKYIGKYGEGYKLALLVLTRLEKDAFVYTNKQKWTPIFEYSDLFEEKLLKVIIEPMEELEDNVIIFEVNNIKQYEMEKLREKFIALDILMGRGIGATRESDYGTILLDSEFEGKFFVNGLFVQTDYNFKYGYNFKNEYVNLDRDRKAINYWDLKELTAKALTKCGDADLFYSALAHKTLDLDNPDIVLGEITENEATAFKNKYYEKNNLPEDTFVGTKKMIEISGSKHVKEENEIITKILFKADNKLDEYTKIKNKLKRKDNEEDAINAFNKSVYKELALWLMKNNKRLSKKAIKEFEVILETRITKPTLFELIKDKIKDLLFMEVATNGNNKRS